MEKYFDKTTFTGLILLLPSTMIIISILLRAVDSDILYRALYDFKRDLNPYLVMNIASLLSLLICFGDIIYLNSSKTDSLHEIIFIQRKSLFNAALMIINISYISIIYLYHDLEKLGNIPVGRN